MVDSITGLLLCCNSMSQKRPGANGEPAQITTDEAK